MTKIRIFKGDITDLNVDAIVNAANTGLLGGGGVDGAIHKKAGKMLLEECIKLKGCDVGEAKITKGYGLRSKYVIHTVGPVWTGGDREEDSLLKKSYMSSCELASKNSIYSLAFPCISTGAYHFPKRRAATIAVNTIKEFLSKDQRIKEIIFCCFSEQDLSLYQELLGEDNNNL